MERSEEAVIVLPKSVVSRIDATRLAREVEILGGHIEQTERSKERTPKSLVPSRVLDDMLKTNKLDLESTADRERLYHFLIELKANAPAIHMSFAVDPPVEFTAKLITWLRDEIHPLVLLDIGLQPTIAAGCIIRTTNKYFDCSVRQHLQQNRPKLREMMHGSKPSHA
jgi:hypothetical protein